MTNPRKTCKICGGKTINNKDYCEPCIKHYTYEEKYDLLFE